MYVLSEKEAFGIQRKQGCPQQGGLGVAPFNSSQTPYKGFVWSNFHDEKSVKASWSNVLFKK